MRLSIPLALALYTSLTNAAALTPRHYTFPALTGTTDWQYVRTTANYQSNAGLSDVSSEQVRCYTSGTKSAATMSVAAGGTVGFKASPNIFHPGPLQFYMAKVPAGQTAATWDGSGNVWFKVPIDQFASFGAGRLTYEQDLC
jgi:hypothetical protein